MKYPLDTYPKVFVIMLRYPNKGRIFDDCIVSYGFPGQPYPDDLLARGPGMCFKTHEKARCALVKFLARMEKSEGFNKKIRWEIVPVYQTWGHKALMP